MALLKPSPLSEPRRLPSATYQVRNEYITDTVSRLRYLQLWVDDPDHALEVDPQVYEKIEREIAIEGPRIFRRHKVAGTKSSVHFEQDPSDPRSTALIPYFEALTGRLQRFTTARYNLADAFFKGMTIGLIEGDWKVVRLPGDTVARRWWFPTEIRDVDKQRVRQEFGPDRRERWTIFDFVRNEWVQIPSEIEWHFIWHRYDTTERSLNYGAGLCQKLVYYWTIKTIAWSTAVRGMERWGFGWVVAKLSGLLGGASTTKLDTYRAKVDALIGQLEKQRESHFFVHDKDNVELDVLEPRAEGGALIKDIITYCDDLLRVFILGAKLPTGGGGPGGSLARAEVEEDSTEALVAYDRGILGETLSRGLGGAIRRCNEANFAALGYADVPSPLFAIREEKAPDYTANMDNAVKAKEIGLPLSKKEVYERTGWGPPDPLDPDDVLEPPALPMMPSSGASPFGGTVPSGAVGSGAPTNRVAAAAGAAFRAGEAGFARPASRRARKPGKDDFHDRAARFMESVEREVEQMRALAQRLVDTPAPTPAALPQPSPVVFQVGEMKYAPTVEAPKVEFNPAITVLPAPAPQVIAQFSAPEVRAPEVVFRPEFKPQIIVQPSAVPPAPNVTVNPQIHVPPAAVEVKVERPKPVSKEARVEYDREGKVKTIEIEPKE